MIETKDVVVMASFSGEFPVCMFMEPAPHVIILSQKENTYTRYEVKCTLYMYESYRQLVALSAQNVLLVVQLV